MRKFIFPILLLLAVIFIYLSFGELESIVDTLKRCDFRYLGLAFVVALAWLFCWAVTMRSIFHILNVEETHRHLFLVVAAANFVNIVAPSGGISGIAVFMDNARQREQSVGRVTVAGALFVLLDYAAFICVLAMGWVVLIRRNNLTISEITASIILLAIAAGLATVVYLGYRSNVKLGKLLAWSGRFINKILHPFIKRDYLQVARAYSFADEFASGLSAIKGRMRSLIKPFFFSIVGKAFLICILALSFLSFATPFSTGTLVGGFSIGYLFVIVSPTPAGIGVVEGALPLALNSLRVQWEDAVIITLIYRLVTFWFPFACGGLAFRRLQSIYKNDKKPQISKTGVS